MHLCICSYGTCRNRPTLISAPAPPCIEYVRAGTLHTGYIPRSILLATSQPCRFLRPGDVFRGYALLRQHCQ